MRLALLLAICAGACFASGFALAEAGRSGERERPRPDGIILFPAGSSEMHPEAILTVDRLSALAKADFANWVTFESCTNDFQSSEMNLALGLRRIEGIEHEMALQGVPPHRMRSVASGSACQDGSRLPDRRVAIRIEKLGP